MIEGLSPYARSNIVWELRKLTRHGEFALIDSLVRQGMVAVDVGANRGDFSARFVRLVGRAGHVHAVEPQPMFAARLTRMAGRTQRLSVHTCAASDQNGRAALFVPVFGEGPHHGLAGLRNLDSPAVSIEVETRKLDDILPWNVDLLKCDAEGHELEVLRGARDLINRSAPVLLLEIEQRHHPERPIADVIGSVQDSGYEGFIFDGARLRGVSTFNVERDQLRWLEGDQDVMPAGYLNTFVFVKRHEHLALIESVM